MAKFVVQKHKSRKLHYDFRMEIHGTLKSWVLPKGPSLDHEIKRLAVEVEEHPLSYMFFEGEIPEGSYGAGEVIVWDRGDYECVKTGGEDSPEHQYDKGRMEFILHGKKLKGSFILVRVWNDEEPPKWLLRKKLDKYSTKSDILKDKPGSVMSLRNID